MISILMEFLLFENKEGQAVDVKFYDSDIPFKADDTWSGKKTRVYVANHCGLDPKACDNETFLREMEDGRDCQLVCLSELAKNSRLHLHPKSQKYLEELAREHPNVLRATGLDKCKSLQLLIGNCALLRDALK